MIKKCETYIYKQVGDCKIKADLYRTENKMGIPPLIIYIHGGALIDGTKADIDEHELALYLSNGFNILSIDYRLAPETKLPEIIKDIQDVFKWARDNIKKIKICIDKVAVIGHSAGGYLTLMSGICFTPKPNVLVSFYGYGDIIGDWVSRPDPFYCQQPKVSEKESGRNIRGPIIAEPYNGRRKEKFYLFLRQNGLWPLEVSGYNPKEERDFFIPYCPLYNIDSSYPPTILLHGNRDTDVPYEQSVLMERELKKNNVNTLLFTINNGEHEFEKNKDDPQTQEAFNQVLFYLRHYLTDKED